MQKFAKRLLKRRNIQNSFFVCDTNIINNSIQDWKRELPDITPYYAVKSNNDLGVLKNLTDHKFKFDCASKKEMKQILLLDNDPEDIIYSHPCKDINHLKYAYKNNINFTVIDSIEEIDKIKKYHPKSNILCRLHVDNNHSRVVLSNKFGCSESMFEDIVKYSLQKQMNLNGLSFHIGSYCMDPVAFSNAICKSRIYWDIMLENNIKPNILNIGGGFTNLNFNNTVKSIKSSINLHFKDYTDQIYIMAEPGRFFVEKAYHLFMRITSKRILKKDQFEYTLNDGLYGALNNNIYDKFPIQIYHAFDYKGDDIINKKSYQSMFWGPSCDGLDCLTSEPINMVELNVGDWVYVPNCGAYINRGAEFNGFEKSLVFTI
mgnify:CR=1 FL=1|jgi:ornithine decarboxylase